MNEATLKARWIMPAAEAAAAVDSLCRELHCGPAFASLLARRGFDSPEAVARFLKPQLKTLGDPNQLPEMEAAVKSVLQAIDARRRIVLYGDYDVDGVTSLALLARLLRAYGAEPACFLPRRVEEGYGLSREGVERCLADHRPELLIALDCGTSAAGEIATLTGRGVEVVVVDHHECKAELPRCTAVVNPKRPDATGDDYRYLCTAGLVFKLCHALLKARPLPFDLREYLDLVAIGTVADLVPLVGENRILVARGLAQIGRSRWPGLRALMEVAAVKTPLTPSEVGFQLGPRLNAAGRLGDACEALELLLTDDPSRARLLAERLNARNRQRREIEKRTSDEAEAQAAAGDPARHAAIVVGREGWHPGVLGIVASRLSRKFHRPALVIGFDESGTGKGSGRSIEGLSLVRALESCGDLLEQFGGHEMAAGLTVRRERFEHFCDAFRESARAGLSEDDLLPKVHLDAEIRLEEIDFAFLDRHEALQPFGIGNPQPLFFASGVKPLAQPRILKEKHLRLVIGQGRSRHEAIFFNAPLEDLPRPPWDIAFRVARNEWRGEVKIEIEIQKIRSGTLRV